MNDLQKYFEENNKNVIHKWNHYFEIYDKHFSKFRNTDVCIAEIGVFHGGSLQMWKDYFGPKCRVIGIDINPNCKKAEENQIEVVIGDQGSKEFWNDFKVKVPKLDILVDDGSHQMNDQIITFQEIFYHISKEGVYLCEDTHTSYNTQLPGSGYKNPASYMEYSKNFVDYINSWHILTDSKNKYLDGLDFVQAAHSVHFYDSIVVIEKRENHIITDAKMTGKLTPCN